MNIDESAYIARGVKLSGDDITIGKNSSVWHNAVLRCSGDKHIRIGDDTNIQDLSMVHVSTTCSTDVGDGVTVGHMCIIHGCTIGDNTLIGMGSTIMDGAKIGSNCIIGAGSLVTKGKEIPEGSMAFGRPAKVIRQLTDEEIRGIRSSAEEYIEEARLQMEHR
ncbi:gamma carbonic anhydrase family protein [Mobilibacterium timonense]|uniref:gamma carbonic anhydrase family protein n=1 Tax=Mobilibacterium timonense TaxID=1871012 RepID=UPI003A95142A